MTKRYKLSDSFWEMIEDLITQNQKTGRPRHDDRLMLNGILWVLCSGAAWRDMPERFGPWSTVYQRFRDWRNRGSFDQMLKRLHIRLNELGFIDLDTWMIDSAAVRATRVSSSAGEKGGLKNRLTMHWAVVSAASQLRFICSAIRTESLCVSTCQVDRPEILLMRSRCLIRFKSQAARGDDLASAVAGYWRTRDTMPNTFGAIATATGCCW